MVKRRTRKKWYAYHLSKAQDAARSEVMSFVAKDIENIQRARDEARRNVHIAQHEEPWLSRLLGFFGVETQYRRDVLQPLQRDVTLATRALGDVLERRRQQLDEAACRGAEEYHEARELRKQEAEARAERVVQRKQERRVQYLERSPAIRSAGRFLKRLLIRQHSSDGTSITCFYCGVTIAASQSHLEHKRPVSRGGDNRRGNIALSCPSCNLKKGRKTHEEFMRERGGAAP